MDVVDAGQIGNHEGASECDRVRIDYFKSKRNFELSHCTVRGESAPQYSTLHNSGTDFDRAFPLAETSAYFSSTTLPVSSLDFDSFCFVVIFLESFQYPQL